MTVTAELPDVLETFTSALATDASGPGRTAPVSAPPRKSDNPDAPHGVDEHGVPLAPYGHKADGRPRIKPGGPGRRADGAAAKDNHARVVDVRPAGSPSPGSSSPSSASAGPDGEDYTEALTDLGQTAWMVGSMFKGGKLLFLPLPDTRPYAAVWRQEMPQLIGAANVACKQSPAARAYLQRASGEGSWSWRIGVAITGASLVAAIAEMSKAPPAVKAAAAKANDKALEEFMLAQMAELGLAPIELGQDGQVADVTPVASRTAAAA